MIVFMVLQKNSSLIFYKKENSGFGHEEKPFVQGNVSVRLSGLRLHGKCRLWVFISSDGRQDNE